MKFVSVTDVSEVSIGVLKAGGKFLQVKKVCLFVCFKHAQFPVPVLPHALSVPCWTRNAQQQKKLSHNVMLLCYEVSFHDVCRFEMSMFCLE